MFKISYSTQFCFHSRYNYRVPCCFFFTFNSDIFKTQRVNSYSLLNNCSEQTETPNVNEGEEFNEKCVVCFTNKFLKLLITNK